jgi:hypothetical protein
MQDLSVRCYLRSWHVCNEGVVHIALGDNLARGIAHEKIVYANLISGRVKAELQGI